ncbi:hypothetical protein E8E12_006065 [Didymella heteroderae]|uniref:C2H2-type domain-containing protein n=1 Tax=Didymella heteroderae TaxID=1769908 RepID=A0A9P4WL65_9PLEO|nr:hypothetical protein E8E12_006065 [Didymella heteroderae]
MSTVNYTKTGRVSKAKKGLKSYTRAEHLRRHQRNHAQEGGMVCKFPDCGKTFFRSDLLQRHEERHNELGGNVSRQPSVSSSEHSAHPSPMSVPASLSMVPAHTLPAVSYPQQPIVSPQPEPSSLSSGSKIIQNMAYLQRHSISGPVPVDAMAASGTWVPESFAPSPYSCSSGYASPAPCPEYGHMYATPPYGASLVRTRASSNASFIEQNWAQASQSPTSSISMPFSWASDEKSLIASTFPYTPVSYATTNMPMDAGIGAIAHFGQYESHTLVQMDNEESAQLFPGEHYGMSQFARAYPFEQWLNSYWRLFHPTFPIVHRFTFDRLETSPMLYAAMVAIGAHFSNDIHDARELHERCVKLLVKRQDMNMGGCDRLCDLQAVFLVEVFALNFARRCARSLSARFIAMFDQLVGLRSAEPSVVTTPLLHDSTDDSSFQDQWLHWVSLSARHRLLAQEYSMMPRCIAEATVCRIAGSYDAFQSSVLIAALYPPSSYATPHLQPAIEHLIHDGPSTKQQLAIAQLVQLAPIGALLAVSGESWILGTKVTSQEEFAAYRTELQSWVAHLWSATVGDRSHSILEALRLSVEILTSSLNTQEPSNLAFNDLGLFYAALVLWAATAAATNKLLGSGLLYQQARSSLESAALVAPMVPSGYPTGQSTSSATDRFAGLQQTALPLSSDQRSSIPRAEILANTSRFLSTVVEDVTSFNVEPCQTGCKSMLLFTKMQLRGSRQDTVLSDYSTSNHNHAELINAAISQIERMLNHEWTYWGI